MDISCRRVNAHESDSSWVQWGVRKNRPFFTRNSKRKSFYDSVARAMFLLCDFLGRRPRGGYAGTALQVDLA